MPPIGSPAPWTTSRDPFPQAALSWFFRLEMCRCFFPAVNCGSDGPIFQIIDRRARLEVRKTASCPRIISPFFLAISTHFQTGFSSAHHFLFSFMMCFLLIPMLSCFLCSAKLCLLPYHFFDHFVLHGALLEAP